MGEDELRKLIAGVAAGRVGIDDAVGAIGHGYVELGFAKPDVSRRERTGVPEVIYGAGKTAEQVAAIIGALRANGQEGVLVTRLDDEKAQSVAALLDDGDAAAVTYHRQASLLAVGTPPKPDGIAYVAVAAAGTSDLRVAEEAALTAEWLGSRVVRTYDVGVAGLHRLLAHVGELAGASCVVAVAGMEGALASVVGGLVSCPVVAVPTSVGYGASLGGISALLSMLNSCASGISVVNIDNGFGAGYQASLIDHVGRRMAASAGEGHATT